MAWLFVFSEVQIYDLHTVQLMAWCHWHPVISYFIKIQNVATFLVPVYPGCPRKEAIKRV